MRIKGRLLLFLLRKTMLVTVIAICMACLYALLRREVLDWRDAWAGVFVLVHSLALTGLLGRFRSGAFAFLYSRGYSRDALWAHTMLATLISALAAWLPAALIVWTPLRGLAQDVLFRSPYFPIMAPREAVVPMAWAAAYGILVPLFHYEWIRRAQPVRGGSGGPFLAAGVIVALAVLVMEGRPHPWFVGSAATAGILAVGALVGARVVASWRLHRRVEAHR